MMQAALWEVEVVRGQSLTWDARSARDGNGFVQGSFTCPTFNHPAGSAAPAWECTMFLHS